MTNQRRPPVVSSIPPEELLEGEYTLSCLSCNYGPTTKRARSVNNAIDICFSPHDEYHRRNGTHCSGDHFSVVCPDGVTREYPKC